MKRLGTLLVLLFMNVAILPTAVAGDFDWVNKLNITAKADLSDFKIRLASRFRIGAAEVRTVISNVDRPSDAYMILRLGELSRRPVNEVMGVYRSNRRKGWGAMAKNLGIKPGSKQFHALKRGHDLEEGRVGKKKRSSNSKKEKRNDKGKGNSKK